MRRHALVLVMVTAISAPRAGRADEATIPWNEAEAHVGKQVTVEGRVLGIHCSPTSCLLAFDPTFNRFTAVVQAKDFGAFPPEKLDAEYVGRQVRVRGTVQLLERKPEIVLARPEDLELVVTPQEKAEKREAAQGALLDRIDAMIDRLDELITRMAASQTQLEQVAVGLAEQSAQIAALQAAASAPPPPPPVPSYGEPQPRPAYEALRTIKRGMTSDEVARLVGEPIYTVSDSSGGYVWDYGYGRTITFDRRGRATALVGFPAP